MLNKRDQRELAEVKALIQDLSRRVDEVMSELQAVREAQDALQARDRELVPARAPGEKRARRRKSGAPKREGGAGGKKRRPPEPVARPSADEG